MNTASEQNRLSTELLRGLKVLFVDEVADDRDLFTIVFETYGARVAAAGTLSEALEKFERFSPEIVVVNLALPHRDGHELIRAIRKADSGASATTPAIAISWGSGEESRRAALEAGFDKVVAKPLDYDELLQIVSSHYERIEALRAARSLELEGSAEWRSSQTTLCPSPTAAETTVVAVGGSLVLGALPERERCTIFEKAAFVELEAGHTLANAGESSAYVVLPLKAMVSMLLMSDSGKTVEVCSVGRNGIAGTGSVVGSHHSPFWMNVHLPGEAWRLRSSEFEALVGELPVLRSLVDRLRFAMVREIAQNVLCNRIHTIEAQLARWLMTIGGRSQADVVRLTHESIAERFGTRRPTISLALEALARGGGISMMRGQIRILDTTILARTACECLKTVDSIYANAYRLDAAARSEQPSAPGA